MTAPALHFGAWDGPDALVNVDLGPLHSPEFSRSDDQMGREVESALNRVSPSILLDSPKQATQFDGIDDGGKVVRRRCLQRSSKVHGDIAISPLSSRRVPQDLRERTFNSMRGLDGPSFFNST